MNTAFENDSCFYGNDARKREPLNVVLPFAKTLLTQQAVVTTTLSELMFFFTSQQARVPSQFTIFSASADRKGVTHDGR